jgi:hypothetical protein
LSKLSQELKKVEYILLSDKDAANTINSLPLVESDSLKVSSGRARGYLTSKKAMSAWKKLHIIENDLDNPLFAIASATLITCRLHGAYFCMDMNTDIGKINNKGLNSLVAFEVIPCREDFLNLSKKYLRQFPIVIPQDILEARLFGESNSKQTGYPYFNSSNKHHVRGYEETIRVTAVLEQVCKVDTEVSLFTWVDDQDTNTFIKLSKPETMIIPRGYRQISVEVPARTLSKATQFTGVSNVLQGFRLSVKAV